MYNHRTITHKLQIFAFTLFLLALTGVITAVTADDETFDDSRYVARSNVVASQVDPSFWEERESLSIDKVQKPLVPPSGKPNSITPSSSHGSNIKGADLTAEELTVIGKAQDMALILINNPYYQAGESVFKLDDKTQVQLSSVKYAATKEYYGRTDVSSSWVTDFYNAAYGEDYSNLTLLLEELPAEEQHVGV